MQNIQTSDQELRIDDCIKLYFDSFQIRFTSNVNIYLFENGFNNCVGLERCVLAILDAAGFSYRNTL